MKSRPLKISILASALALLLFILYYIAWMLAPGSYPRAEKYTFSIPEDSLIRIIEEVKKESPELNLDTSVKVPNGGNFELEDGRKSYWYSIYFFYSDKQEIIHTWTRPIDNNSTTFAFVGINSGLTLGNWRTVNSSFWWWQSDSDIEEFERRILTKITKKTNLEL